ncbi:type ISP restriction/modification enzyme [Methylobacterium sp. 88A]|uniref:type ISP restriction/modification enzyme n=1 Tax=Methylobacterium sp. 88A TaxID=1131813 RepID=UPI0003765040|nr:type ISP restriction/modification enzyme [Methylobacterium sp. 88A]
MSDQDRFQQALSTFGRSTKAKFAGTAITGAPEDQLRAPLEALILALSELGGTPPNTLTLVGETTLAGTGTRPDYAISLRNVLIGFIEVKAPGKGADPRRFRGHDRAQWEKLKALPNLLYTDGNAFSLWRDGILVGAVVRVEGDVETSGAELSAPTSLLALITDFLAWKPTPARTAKQLADVSARLCRLLRDEVVEQMESGSSALKELAIDWRSLLFPEASDAEFADGYAQAVTFGLLVARARGIPLAQGIEGAAQVLRRTNSLIGTALLLLADDRNQDALQTSLSTLTRVLDVVEWGTVSRGDPDAWLYFYEEFLEVYDNALRKRTGSYYTPPEVVEAMVRLVDEALTSPERFDRPLGLASPDVIIADPAVGTGTFLLGVLRRIARIVENDHGAGAVGSAITASADRLVGFELQFGPFAVAQLRLLAEMQTLTRSSVAPKLRLFITDTLGNPFVEDERLPQILQPIGQSRREANQVKRGQPITVVIGNPPYKEKAKGRGGWIEEGSDGREAPLDRWSSPAAWGVSAHAKHLKNLYVYFWRWATWKVFGSGLNASTGIVETDQAGIICYITVAGFLNGPGFQKMRDDLRRQSSEIWVIDCSPEGHQPDVPTRIFQGVQQPICIVLAARKAGTDPNTPAHVRFRALPEGRRADKFMALSSLSLDDGGWVDAPSGWRDPFLSASAGAWATYPELAALFLYDGSGVMPGRTWVIAPDPGSLEDRWTRLIRERSSDQQDRLFYPHQNGDKTVSKRSAKGLTGHEHRHMAVGEDQGSCVTPTRYGFRSFDRQWIVPDNRLINRANPTLWDIFSTSQVYLTAFEAHSPSSGPAVTFTGFIPDLHHYKGSFGGRAYPLWGDRAAEQSNVRPALLTYLAATYRREVSSEDMMAYIAAVLAHPAFIQRFAADLTRPGLRVPLTADPVLFTEAVTLGREVIWLHCYGERFADPASGRPARAPRLPIGEGPTIPSAGAIPPAPEPLPQEMRYESEHRRLHVGKGYIDNVDPRVWAYEVSGKQIVPQWFSYRRRDRSRPVIGDRRPPSPLDQVQPEGWLASYTSDLLDLLHVLGRLVALEPAQADLLGRICAGQTLDVTRLSLAGALEGSIERSGVANVDQGDLFG